MRNVANGSFLRVKAIAGTHVVILAWDFDPATRPQSQAFAIQHNLLGFAIERTEFDAQGQPRERYWLRGIKRFEHKDPGQPPGAQMPTSEHPVQTFQWGDYTVDPSLQYAYQVVPVFGTPKLLQLDSARATRVEIRTEPETTPAAPAAVVKHEIYFNRGVIGSQAYARRFGSVTPNADKPGSAPMRWLSRGLYEALLAFIGRARGARYTLRAAFYEFGYRPVARALRAAVESGADVKIVYDDESSYKTENRATLHAAGLDNVNAAVPRTVTEGIRHNKFIVLLEDGHPIAVWTGSTNISAGGIFGHSNVGHVVNDAAIAADYLAYWARLAANLTPSKLRKPNVLATTLPAGPPWQPALTALFSPRDEVGDETTLKWYADRMNEARRIVCFTAAFDIDPLFQAVLAQDNDVLRYIVKDDDLSSGENIGRDHDVLFAAGGRLDEGALANFLAESENPLNRNDYIHTKYMLVDPLGDNPLVVTGSANFSRASQWRNDQKQRFLPRMATGELASAIAMTEPGTGSDLQGVRTHARRDGDEYVINGAKTFITNGQNANLVIVVCKTDREAGAKGVSLLLVETEQAQGFRRGRKLDKVGLKSQDTSELFFDDVRVPAANLLGGVEGRGFFQLMDQLPQERLIIALQGVAAMERALEETLAYVKQRKAFGKPIWDFQNTRFKLAEVQATVLATRAFVDACMVSHLSGELDAARAALAKSWVSEQQGRVMDECLQLFGGYGYMMEYPIAELYVDARVQRIYGGTNEIMKELASRFM